MTTSKPIVSLRKPAPVANPAVAERFVHTPEPGVPVVSAPQSATEPASAVIEPAPAPSAANANGIAVALAHPSDAPKTRPRPPEAAPATKRKVMHRKDGRALRATTVYFPVDVARKLAMHCAETELGMSDFITELVAKALDSKRDS